MLSNKKKTVLIYYPFSTKSIAIESQVEILIRLNFEVLLITWNERGELHERCEQLGAKCFSTAPKKNLRSAFFFFYQGYRLLSFCQKYNVSVIFVHFQSLAMVAGLAAHFRKLWTIYFRHNTDYFELRNSRKELFFNRMANRFSHTIIAISNSVRKQLLKEGVRDGKIKRIDLAYNFSRYGKPNRHFVQAIREKYLGSVLLLMPARLDPLKRHIHTFEVIKSIRNEGIDCKLICIGEGELKRRLQKWIVEKGMDGNIVLEGFVPNVIDYMEACDIIINLSYSEASNQVVKEAGLFKKPVIVCRGVGNFDEYLEDHLNAFLVDKESPVEPTISLLRQFAHDKTKLAEMGKRLHEVVISRFSMESVIDRYEELLQQKVI